MVVMCSTIQETNPIPETQTTRPRIIRGPEHAEACRLAATMTNAPARGIHVKRQSGTPMIEMASERTAAAKVYEGNDSGKLVAIVLSSSTCWTYVRIRVQMQSIHAYLAFG